MYLYRLGELNLVLLNLFRLIRVPTFESLLYLLFRFHGAFTGGFSSGYYNTVSTKEGWTPSQFFSTRAQRSETVRQQPEDYMDEEDFSDQGIAPKRFQPTESYSLSNKIIR